MENTKGTGENHMIKVSVKIDNEIVEIDEELVRLVKVMNRFPGIKTTECCSGHGKQKSAIWFVPESIKVLPSLLYWFDTCHSGCYWPVYIYTDCSADHVTWVVEARVTGEEAYQEAAKIAACMEKYLDEEINTKKS